MGDPVWGCCCCSGVVVVVRGVVVVVRGLLLLFGVVVVVFLLVFVGCRHLPTASPLTRGILPSALWPLFVVVFLFVFVGCSHLLTASPLTRGILPSALWLLFCCCFSPLLGDVWGDRSSFCSRSWTPESPAVPIRRFSILGSRPAVLVKPTGRCRRVEGADRLFVACVR